MNDDVLTATFLQKVNRRNRVYQLERLKGFLETVPQNAKINSYI